MSSEVGLIVDAQETVLHLPQPCAFLFIALSCWCFSSSQFLLVELARKGVSGTEATLRSGV